MRNALPEAGHWSRGEKALVAASGAFVLLATLALWWWHALNAAPPVVAIPTPVPPQPNAFDFYVRAGAVEVSALGAATTSPDPRKPRAPLPARQALLRANQPALKTLREGFRHRYHAPPARSFSTLFPHSATFREMARLLRFEGDLHAERGAWGQAASSYVDAIHFGNDLPRGGGLMGCLIGDACEAIGRRSLWGLADKLSAREARSVVRRLEAMEAKRHPFADMLQEEKWTGLASLIELFGKQNTLEIAHDLAPSASGSSAPPLNSARMTARLVWRSKRRIVADHVSFMDACVAQARQPYAAKQTPPPVPDDPINELILPEFTEYRLKSVDTQMQTALLLAVLALRAYQAEHHGVYPATLDDLVRGGYLLRVPADPFALAGPIRYQRAPKKYVLYSVGPDGKNEGGKPINNRDSRGKQKRYVEAGTTGDFVAHVNVY